MQNGTTGRTETRTLDAGMCYTVTTSAVDGLWAFTLETPTGREGCAGFKAEAEAFEAGWEDAADHMFGYDGFNPAD